MGVKGYFLFRGDKTVCGGKILEGCTDHQFFDKDMACEGHKVTCGKHPGHYRICGGLEDDIHGKRIAGTLHSYSSCPCKSKFVPSNWDDDYELGGEPTVTHMDLSHLIEIPELPGPIADPKTDTFADTCKPEDNPLLNGVYIWTETTSAGHAFVSVHENNNIYLYTYGRYGRTDRSTLTGDGILDFFQDEDARKYYRYELYEMGARAFRIDDAEPELIRKFFEKLWNNGVSPIQTPKMQDGTIRRGRTIDKYDVTGNNCTTHSVEGIKFAGSKVFDHGYTSTTTQLPIDIEEDFTIPVSLQSFLESKSADYSSMLVVEMTSTFKQQYPNIENKNPQPLGGSAKIQQAAADSAAVAGSASPYSGGTVGGSLGSTYDYE
ncbi:TPA: PAAR domain-containing protein [Enterobacter kobei]|uniref:PAAR domain-containing protein n=4 Tax=Enterobacter kobei TaxID=208224 RepID=UPI000EF1FB21|nr:PAAR domain-containing protein [Enterobacter kobei]AYL07062.1 PAAR domain-containing protein [Enterobacter kobei]MCK7348066.1 PAAR domain-containing protein [Enterobacter kobei]MDD9218644.1 PAAR domain-containing protein [Enterobacter kobei]MDI3137716.1 PAAR domain-containing protein [Enterobacter kobei]QIP20865.1 PAAR domain-containing protein [Enterobacter kobei]